MNFVLLARDTYMKNTDKKSRPLVVAVLGHVDHGKTTLLDAIRGTKVVAGESGGITQNIGISAVTTEDGNRFTFIDTPGHAAFSEMRSQGAKVADVAVLVVAADDGVMPQTKEAIDYIKKEGIPFVVAITKTDLPGANLEKTYSSLEKEEVFLEGRGGDTPCVPVSGKTGTGISDLLEMISLVAEVSGVDSGGGGFYAVVIETGRDRRGVLVILVVKSGVLKVGDLVVAAGKGAKVRGIFDESGKSVKEIGSGRAALVLGFSDLPPVGAKVVAKGAKEEMLGNLTKKPANVSLESGKPVFLIKTKNQGTLSAISASLNKEAAVLDSGVGDVTENDVFLAKPAHAVIIAFESKVPGGVSKLADTEGVEIKKFDVVYDLFDFVNGVVEGGKEKIVGSAKILKTFPFEVTKKIAGCKIVSGEITKKSKLRLEREGKVLGEIRAISIKKGKVEMEVAKNGEEFGIYFLPQLDFAPSDMIISVAEQR